MPPKRLALVRHAKSSWADPGIIDHDRPLSSRGRRAALLVGGHLRQVGLRPDLVLCSSATRAQETLELLQLPTGSEVLIDGELYAAPAGVLLARLRQVPAEVTCVLLIGHNPGIEELAGMLVAVGTPLPEKFPTAAVADLSLPIRTWRELDAGSGELSAFITPRSLAVAPPPGGRSR